MGVLNVIRNRSSGYVADWANVLAMTPIESMQEKVSTHITWCVSMVTSHKGFYLCCVRFMRMKALMSPSQLKGNELCIIL